MRKYIIKKLFYNILIVIFILITSFFILRSTSNPIKNMFGTKSPTNEERQILEKKLGLDGSLIKQFIRYIKQILYLDFGKSYYGNCISAFQLFIEAFVNTFQLSLWSCLIGSLIGIFFGILSKFYDNKKNILFDIFAILFISTPTFIIGFILQYFLAYKCNIFNISGFDSFRDMVLPISTLSLVIGGRVFKITQNTIEECLSQPYIIAAYAKGLSKKMVFFKHALKNALIPILTYVGLIFSFLIGGTVITEYIFNIKGVGHLIMESYENKDLNVLQCSIILISVFISFFNLLLECILVYINPQLNKKI